MGCIGVYLVVRVSKGDTPNPTTTSQAMNSHPPRVDLCEWNPSASPKGWRVAYLTQKTAPSSLEDGAVFCVKQKTST